MVGKGRILPPSFTSLLPSLTSLLPSLASLLPFLYFSLLGYALLRLASLRFAVVQLRTGGCLFINA